MATVAERIREAMNLRRMKQSELSALTGIGKSSISTYLSGEYEPKQRNLHKLAVALDVNESWLLGEDVPRTRSIIFSAANADTLTEYPDELTVAEFLKLGYELVYYKDGIYRATNAQTSETYYIPMADFEPGEKTPQQRATEILQELKKEKQAPKKRKEELKKGKQELQDALYRLYQKADQRDQMLVRQILSRYGDDLDCLEK